MGKLSPYLIAACIAIAAACGFGALQQRAHDRAQIEALQTEREALIDSVAALKVAREADQAALLAAQGREDRVRVVVREVTREIERDPTREACRTDPAILRAYDAIGRMRDAATAGAAADPAP